ncbi:Transcriptional regulator, PadR-like family [Frankia canadensis]|uniref:Transcriptional regulator, PadR-like family n=1 Tax=Frankia canadensis TaxID=1836972 RepID=A0A2I2KJM9_9ACTN|nr:PadR family transcriptional regulator [Frankia canadensis]SNQ45879.1 Transcriptional regulator, PadR-like family [Frankia canadensis]SOU53169.1 Transcriptional regulator, PadR-like family [Frankia canadensis]
MGRRKVSNPLALAVLALLNERPMHPYEMSSTLRERHKEESIKLNYGSLYTVVEALVRAGFIVAARTVRDGRRPERTIYELTEPGRVELYDWMAELVGTPAKEYTRFDAALSLLPVLAPGDAVRLLADRRLRLTAEVEAGHAARTLAEREGLPRLFALEHEYQAALRQAELDYVERLLAEISARTLDGIELWELFHADPDDPEASRDAVTAVQRELARGRWAGMRAILLREMGAHVPGGHPRPGAGSCPPATRSPSDPHRPEDPR